jgi:hypothetical protein
VERGGLYKGKSRDGENSKAERIILRKKQCRIV